MCMEIKNLAIQQQLENPQRALSAILGRVDENEEVLDDEGEPATPTLPTKPEDMSVVDLIVAMASDRVRAVLCCFVLCCLFIESIALRFRRLRV